MVVKLTALSQRRIGVISVINHRDVQRRVSNYKTMYPPKKTFVGTEKSLVSTWKQTIRKNQYGGIKNKTNL